jgi:DNA-directed RNA polymerase specialized sigma24 family protein
MPAPPITGFAQKLAQYFRANRTDLIRTFIWWAQRATVEDAVQEAMVRIFARYDETGEPEPVNLDALVRTTVRNILIDGFRRAALVSIGYVRSAPDGQPIFVPPSDADADDFSGDPALPSKFASAEDELAWKHLLRALLDDLDPKYVHVATMAMLGATPEEIGDVFQQNGYVLRRYARLLLCRAIAQHAQAGDPLAAMLERDCCPRKAAPKH